MVRFNKQGGVQNCSGPELTLCSSARDIVGETGEAEVEASCKRRAELQLFFSESNAELPYGDDTLPAMSVVSAGGETSPV